MCHTILPGFAFPALLPPDVTPRKDTQTIQEDADSGTITHSKPSVLSKFEVLRTVNGHYSTGMLKKLDLNLVRKSFYRC